MGRRRHLVLGDVYAVFCDHSPNEEDVDVFNNIHDHSQCDTCTPQEF